MATTAETHQRPGFTGTLRIPRSRGAVSGTALVLLGIWGGIIPFVGPVFGYAYTPDVAWHFNIPRLYLEILPGAAAVLGGLILLGSGNRATASLGAWLATVSGAWFILGPVFSQLWNGGAPAAGLPAGASTLGVVVQQVGFFYGLGAVILYFSVAALGRISVVGYKDLARNTERAEQHSARHHPGEPEPGYAEPVRPEREER